MRYVTAAMRKSSLFLVLAALTLFQAPAAIAVTVVNSTLLSGGRSYRNYSNAANWSPAEVPNNSADKIYNVTIATLDSLSLDTDATVANLMLAGQFLSLDGRSYTVTGTATLDAETGLLAVHYGAFTINGSLSNF